MNLLNLGTIYEDVEAIEVPRFEFRGQIPFTTVLSEQICFESSLLHIGKLELPENGVVWVQIGGKDYIVEIINNVVMSVQDRRSYYVDEDSGETFINVWFNHSHSYNR